ncbi:MAG: DNA methylase [Firmicutes bacterium]|nr:DNA methylase [Bacillota bacterium]
MNEKNWDKTYIAIDLKSFYASVECRERGRDPLTTNLVVADRSRTSKTICLAVSPALKSYGIPGRPRLFEVEQAVQRINAERLQRAPGRRFTGSADNVNALAEDPSLKLGFIAAVPRMAKYIEYSTKIYQIYLKYAAPEDIHVYSIDEVFIDATLYLRASGKTAHEYAMTIIQDVLKNTGITATAGIGPNLYLCKIAMDIEAKHIAPDADGVRIAELDERSYREYLWPHRPITDFWRIGPGIAKRLAKHGMYTMGDVARCSIGGPADVHNEDLLYRLFGVNAELLIDHAWGYEPCEIKHIKAYKPEENSISSGQVLSRGYTVEEARTVVREMADSMALDLAAKGLTTDQIVISLGYDAESLQRGYAGEVQSDWYGKTVPKGAHGSENLSRPTASTRLICEAAMRLFDRIADPSCLVRRMYVVAAHTQNARAVEKDAGEEQLDLFTDYGAAAEEKKKEEADLAKEGQLQQALLAIKNRYGKNAVMPGTSYQEEATGRERNDQIGGHRK